MRSFFTVQPLRRWLIRLAFVATAMVTLAALALAYENWRAARDWRAWAAEATASGKRLDLASLAPAPVPPEENFGATPLFKPLFDDEDKAGTGAVPHDPEGSNDSEALKHVRGISAGEGDPSDVASPDLINWWWGKKVNLTDWAAFYRHNRNYPNQTDELAPAPAVLFALGKFEADLGALRSASARPASVFPLHFEKGPEGTLPHLGPLMRIEGVASLRAIALGQSEREPEALAETLFAQRLAEALRSEPIELSLFTRSVMHGIALQPVWEMLERRRLSEAQLADLQAELAKVNLIEQVAGHLWLAKVFQYTTVEAVLDGRLTMLDGVGVPPYGILRFMQGIVARRNGLAMMQYYSTLGQLMDPVAGRVDLPAIAAVNAEYLRSLKTFHSVLHFLVLIHLSTSWMEAVEVAQAQANQNMAVVACALERWRLAHGDYPDATTALVPEFLAKLPPDPVTGQPLHYRRTPDGRYLLYSVGPEGRDEGGRIALEEDQRPAKLSRKAGNWVWQYTPVQLPEPNDQSSTAGGRN